MSTRFSKCCNVALLCINHNVNNTTRKPTFREFNPLQYTTNIKQTTLKYFVKNMESLYKREIYLSNRVENIAANGEINQDEQFLYLS